MVCQGSAAAAGRPDRRLFRRSRMKGFMMDKSLSLSARIRVCSLLVTLLFGASIARSDETCNSPYISNLIKGQEDFIHVWTLGDSGLGDGSDKLVTVDVNPASKSYGKVIATVSVGGRGEAHHMGFTDDRKYLWAGDLDDSKIYVFDVGSNPSKPRLVRTITDLSAKTGFVGPHTFYALPGRLLIGSLSNSTDKGGITGLALYNNKGAFIAKYDIPTGTVGGVKGDGYGYDVAVNPAKERDADFEFHGLDKLHAKPGRGRQGPGGDEALRLNDGGLGSQEHEADSSTQRPGAPLEIRWALAPGQNWAVTAAALTSKIWLIKQSPDGTWTAKEVATIGDPQRSHSRSIFPFPPTAKGSGSTRSWTG